MNSSGEAKVRKLKGQKWLMNMIKEDLRWSVFIVSSHLWKSNEYKVIWTLTIRENGRVYLTTISVKKHGGKLLFQGNLKKQDIPLLDIREPFLREITEQWTNRNFTEKNPDFNSSCIRHNSLIRIESRPFFYRTWFNAGVKVVWSLLDKEGNFLSYNNFISKFNIKTNYLEYYKIISTVTRCKKVCSPALGDNAKADNENLLANSKICKKVYQHLIEKKASIPLKSQKIG